MIEHGGAASSSLSRNPHERHDAEDTAALNERHRQRMERKKAVIDAKIAAADKKIGIIIVNTGNGKGKSSSAFGMVMRAWATA
jgi:hypothetical protein